MEQAVADQVADPNRQDISNSICRKEKQREKRRKRGGYQSGTLHCYTNPIIAALHYTI